MQTAFRMPEIRGATRQSSNSITQLWWRGNSGAAGNLILPATTPAGSALQRLESNATSSARSRTQLPGGPSHLHRIYMVNWSQACTAQVNRPLWQLQQANYGGCLFAVSALIC